jgi:hypothetical protein
VAISNHRLLAFDGDHVTFSYKDYAHGDRRRFESHAHSILPAPPPLTRRRRPIRLQSTPKILISAP